MSKFAPFAGQTYTLSSSIGSFDTSIILSSFLVPITNTPITMALLNTDIVYATISPKTTSVEFISFTTIVQNPNGTATISGITRGLARIYPFTANTAYNQPHAGQSQFIISDAPQLFNEYVTIPNAETITGIKTFATGATPLITDAPTDNLMAANKLYVDSTVASGSPDASTTVKGVTKMSVAPASPTAPIAVGANDWASASNYGISKLSTASALSTAPIAVGDNDTRVPTVGQAAALVGDNTDIAVGSDNNYVTQTGLQKNSEIYAATSTGNDTYVITLSPVPISYDNGRHYFFKVDVGNTGAATLNVNSLGAISIVTGLSTALITGDILANQVCEVIYNSTGPVFQLVNPASIALTAYKDGDTTFDLSTTSGVQNIAHGLGKIPKFITLDCYYKNSNTAGDFNQSHVKSNGSTVSYVSMNQNNSTNTLTTSALLIYGAGGTNQTQSGVVTFDATNIIITWTKASSPTGTLVEQWTAQG